MWIDKYSLTNYINWVGGNHENGSWLCAGMKLHLYCKLRIQMIRWSEVSECKGGSYVFRQPKSLTSIYFGKRLAHLCLYRILCYRRNCSSYMLGFIDFVVYRPENMGDESRNPKIAKVGVLQPFYNLHYPLIIKLFLKYSWHSTSWLKRTKIISDDFRLVRDVVPGRLSVIRSSHHAPIV